MKRNLTDYEHEIVNQILIAEICFDVCVEIPVIPGLGAHFYPFLYNLSLSKGVLSLHSLLDPTHKELSVKNWLAENQEILSKRPGYQDFLTAISKLSDDFQKSTPWPLRHKVIAHLDPKFKHADFTCAYITPDHLAALIGVMKDLKDVFFGFCNYAKDDYPFARIRDQVKLATEKINVANTKY